MRRVIAVLIAIVACGWVAQADQLAKGDNELVFDFSYEDFSVDSPSPGVSGVDTKDINLAGRWGYLLTNRHEVGGVIDYSKSEVGSADSDSIGIGAFYAYNFAAGTNLNPFLEGHFLTIGGDAGDVFDNQYGIAGGVKVYPWENGGFDFGVSWDQLKGASSFPDADGFTLFGGILVKWGP
jgi:hypothetical protein